MGQTKHTPGPWHMHEEHGGASGGHEIHTNFDIGGDKGHYVVATIKIHSTVDLETSRANARLITAAPELLEACKLLYKAWEELLPNLKNGVVQDYGLVLTTAPLKATAAIAKAEGK